MINAQILKQIALSVLTRRKKWVLLVSLLGVALFMPVAYMMSKEPPRHRTVSTVLMETRPDRAPLFQEWALIPNAVADGEWWRLLTSGFLHFGPIHLLFNMMALWVIGRDIEPALGRAGYPELLALELAATIEVDLHAAVSLRERGCPPETAARILL